jgi:hypothetical protein
MIGDIPLTKADPGGSKVPGYCTTNREEEPGGGCDLERAGFEDAGWVTCRACAVRHSRLAGLGGTRGFRRQTLDPRAAAGAAGCTIKRHIRVRLRYKNGRWQSEDPAIGADGYLLALDSLPILENWLAHDGLLETALANGVAVTLSPFRFPGATQCLERTGHELGITWYRDSHAG